MKIRLNIPSSQYGEVKTELEKHGIEISDDAPLVISAANEYSDWLNVKQDKEHLHIPVSSVIFMESLAGEVLVHTQNGVFQTHDRLAQLEKTLDPSLFLRISNSVIIARKSVRKITAAFTQKFILTLSDGSQADVTRSYYYIFKREFGI